MANENPALYIKQQWPHPACLLHCEHTYPLALLEPFVNREKKTLLKTTTVYLCALRKLILFAHFPFKFDCHTIGISCWFLRNSSMNVLQFLCCRGSRAFPFLYFHSVRGEQFVCRVRSEAETRQPAECCLTVGGGPSSWHLLSDIRPCIWWVVGVRAKHLGILCWECLFVKG